MAVEAPAAERPTEAPIVPDPDVLGGRCWFDNLADDLTLDVILLAYPTLDHTT